MTALFHKVVALLLLVQGNNRAEAWILSSSSSISLSPPRRISTLLHVSANGNEQTSININKKTLPVQTAKCRREFFRDSLLSVSTGVLGGMSIAITAPSQPAQALVKGNAPPPKTSKPSGDKPKCTNVEECQALAEQKEQQERQEADASSVPPQVTKGGTRYRDLEVGGGGDASSSSNAVVKDGDEVTLYYKVLKLGKRSYDGLSGEGTVVFSRGYGLEDDEKKPGDKSFITTVGAPYNIVALNEALIGMKEGGLRRFSIFPSKGWRKPGQSCDGGPGGSGAGGDLKTDYVVVPTATMVAAEACFDATKLPFPSTSYAQQRRMAQRFDQSLIMEVQVVSIRSGGGLF